mgnify:CR=1 FL=1
MLVRLLMLSWAALLALGPLDGAAREATPAASPAAGTGLAGAVGWLLTQQAEDGGFPGFSGESDPGVTLDAVVALAAAERAGVDTGGAVADALAWLAQGDVALVYAQTGVGQAAKLALGLMAAGEDPRSIGSVDPLTLVERGQDATTGIYGSGIFDHALAIMALAAAGEEVPASAIDALAATQADNGGWAFDASTDPTAADSNTTAMVVQALVAAGAADSPLLEPALAYLQSTITPEGAVYAPNQGAIADANSTALVLQAVIAAGSENTATLENALVTFQAPSGAFFYQAQDQTANLFSTVQAIPALAGLALPVLPADVATPQAWWQTAAA